MATVCILLGEVVCLFEALQSSGVQSILVQEMLQKQDKLKKELFKHFFCLPSFPLSGSPFHLNPFLDLGAHLPWEPALRPSLALPLQ